MRRLTGTISLRTTLLVAGVSLVAGAAIDPSILRSAVVAAEDSAKEAATVEEAAKVLDLRTLPLPEGAVVTLGRHIGTVSYEVPADFKKAFQFQQQQLAKLGWKELPGSVNQATYSSATFQKSGFVVSVMCYPKSDPDKKGMSDVFVYNYGNVPMSKIPAVKGAKAQTVTAAIASYTTTLKSTEAVAATRKLLVDAGWEPYGSTKLPPDSEILVFKRNAIRLSAHVGVAPGNQAQFTYSLSLMAADIPAPPDADNVNLNDLDKTLKFETAADFDAVAKFYRQRLAKQGWSSKSEELFKRDNDSGQPVESLFFLNAAKDRMTLDLEKHAGQTHATIAHVTAAEFAESEKRQRTAVEKLVAEKKAREEAEKKSTAPKGSPKKTDDGLPDVNSLVNDALKDALKNGGLGAGKTAKDGKAKAVAKDAVSVPIPEGAKKVTQTSDNVLQIKWPANKGKASAEALRDQLLAAGWEAEDGDKIEKNSGNVTFTKDGKTLTLSFVDTGFADVNMMLIGIGVKLTEGKADPDAKAPTASAKPKSKPKTDSSDDDPIKALKKKLGSKPSKSDDDDKPAVKLPPRAEKPIRDIAKLDKLPNEVKLVADGKTVALPHIIAYEIVADDRWVTRILATKAPIKQSSLIGLLQKNGADDELRSMTPRVLVELDEQDKPIGMSYAGNGSLGSASGSGMTGEAIVEEGRVRGTFKAKKESEFFGKKIIGEISFDLPVLTRDSQPAKQLANAKKLETSGNLVVNNNSKKLANFVAYQVKSSSEVETVIFFSEKPINLAKLKAALAKEGTDSDYIDFSTQVKVTINKNDKPAFLNLYADGASINQNTGLLGDVIVEDGRARGTVKLDKAIEFAGKNINFDLTFDVEVLMLPTTAKE